MISTPLTPEEVNNLNTGTRVHIDWSGGNKGDYYIVRNLGEVFPLSNKEWIAWMNEELTADLFSYKDPISFVGSAPPFTVVLLDESD